MALWEYILGSLAHVAQKYYTKICLRRVIHPRIETCQKVKFGLALEFNLTVKTLIHSLRRVQFFYIEQIGSLFQNV